MKCSSLPGHASPPSLPPSLDNTFPQAKYYSKQSYDLEKLEPVVAKPHSPDNKALAKDCRDIKIDRVYIGSCTGGKTEDFAAAARVLQNKKVSLYFFFFSFISLIVDGPHHYHPACGHKGSSHLSPVHALQFFYRDASSALLQLVNQWLNFTYSRSHAFRYERKKTNPTLVRIELTTSVLANVQLTY